MDCRNWLLINYFKGKQPIVDEHVGKPNNDTYSENTIANVEAECNNKEVLVDKRKLHFDIHFGGIEISYSALIGLFRMLLGLITNLIQGTGNLISGYLARIASYVWYSIPGFKSEQIPKTDNNLLRTVDGKNSLKSYVIVEEESKKDSNYISGLILNVAQQNIYSGHCNLRLEEDVNQILHNDSTHNSTQEDLSSDKESHRHETSPQTEMSVHIKSEASPRNLRKIQSFPEEEVAVSKQHEYQDEPEILEKLKKLDEIKKDAERWTEEIAKFDGNNRTFLHIQEMLLRDIDAADLVYADGKDVIKQTKRDIITFVQEELDKLQTKNKNTHISTQM